MQKSVLIALFASIGFFSQSQAQVVGCIVTPGAPPCIRGPGGGPGGPGDQPGRGDRGDMGRPGEGRGGGENRGGPGDGRGDMGRPGDGRGGDGRGGYPGDRGGDWRDGRGGHGDHGGGGRPRPPMPPPPMPPPPPPPRPPMPPQPPYPPDMGERLIQKTIVINRYVRGERLPLLSMISGFDLRDLEGSILDSVVVGLSGNLGGMLTLSSSQGIEDRQFINNSVIQLRSMRPVQLGAYARLDLDIDNMVYVNAITINARSRGGNGGYQPVELRLPVYRGIYNFEQIDLRQMLRLDQYQGFRVAEVVVRARSMDRAWGSINLVVNGYRTGNIATDGITREYRLLVGNAGILGRDVMGLNLEASQVALDEVVVRLQR